MANPVGSILHCRYIWRGSSDRSLKFSWGWTFACYDDTPALSTPTGPTMTWFSNTLAEFTNVPATGATHDLGYYVSDAADHGTNAVELVMYDVSNALGSGELSGAPYAVYPYTPGASAGGQPLPEQVCHVLAWRADYGTDPEFGTSTRPRADDRNRMYFGPLDIAVLDVDSEVPPRSDFASTFLNDVQAAFQQLVTTLNGDGGPSHQTMILSAWSRKNAAIKDAVDFAQSTYPATQRRRLSRTEPLSWVPA